MIILNDFKVFLLYVWHRLDQNHIMHSSMHPAESVNTEVLISEILHFKNQCSIHVMVPVPGSSFSSRWLSFHFHKVSSDYFHPEISTSGERKASPIELRYHHSPRQRKNKEQGSDFNPEDEAIWACVRTGASEIAHSQWDWFWSFLVENKLKLWIKYCLT